MNNIYIEMDGLFDSRLTLLSSLHEDTAVNIFNNNYNTRTSDKFGNIPFDVFNVYYENRNKGILLYSLPTYIYKIIETITIDYYTDLKNIEVPNQTLYVNTYPYKFTDNELELFKERFNTYIKHVDVEFIEYNNHDLTTSILNKYNIRYIIKYDGIEWLEKQNALLNFIENPIIDKYLYVPAVFNYHTTKKINKEFFNALESSLGIITNVVFTDIIYWNAIKEKI